MEKSKFTKEHSAAIKGVAIIFLLCYHCFSTEQRLYGVDVNFWPFDKSLFMSLCYVMVICVGMFVFVFAYGLTISLKKQFENYQFTAQEATVWVLKRYMNLFFMFLIPFIFCAAVTFLTDTSRYGDETVKNIVSFLADLFGVGHMFNMDLMVNTWWYVSLIVFVTVFMPFVVRFYKSYGWLIIPMILIPGSFWIEKHVHLTKYLFVVPLAVCFADQQVFERLKDFCFFKKRWIDKVIRFVVLTALWIALWWIYRQKWGMGNFEFLLNGIYPLITILWCYEFLIDLPIIKQILVFLGNHSANIFYVHTFIRAMWLKKFTYSFKYMVLIFGVLLGLSVIISLFLEGVKKLIRYERYTNIATNKIVLWLNQVTLQNNNMK